MVVGSLESKVAVQYLTIEAVGIKTVKLPARSPNLNLFAQRWVRAAKGLSNLILFGESSL